MNKRTLQANVLRGVRLLDEKDPYWWNGENTPPAIVGMVGHIDLEKLDMGEAECCVLGQRRGAILGNPFVSGAELLGISAFRTERLQSLGFYYESNSESGNAKGYSTLTELWAAVIQSRRYPRRKIARDPFCLKANETWVRA